MFEVHEQDVSGVSYSSGKVKMSNPDKSFALAKFMNGLSIEDPVNVENIPLFEIPGGHVEAFSWDMVCVGDIRDQMSNISNLNTEVIFQKAIARLHDSKTAFKSLDIRRSVDV
jgi:hypothetical protein